jgi:hypothetical protein
VFQHERDHEKRLQAWEIGYLLCLDDFWLDGNLWVCSSFTLYSAYYRFDTLLYKLFLLLISTFSRANLPLQALLFWIFTVLFFLKYSVFSLPFRCLTSNIISSSCLSLLVVGSSFGLANCYGVTNVVMVASVETLW